MFKRFSVAMAFVALCVTVVPQRAYAGAHCDIKCIWEKIVKKNPPVPGICYFQIAEFGIDTALKYIWSNYASEVTGNQNIEFETLTSGSFNFGGGFNLSGADGLVLVKQIGDSNSFGVFHPDPAIAAMVAEKLTIGTDITSSSVSSGEIAAAIKENVLVKPRNLTFKENDEWLKNREDFFDETWKNGYSQSLSMQQALAKASTGAHNFITTIGDVDGDASDEDDSDIRLMMDKYKDSLASLEEALLLSTQMESSYQVLDAASSMVTKRTDDFEDYGDDDS